MTATTTRELAYRENDGIQVSLVWRTADDRLTVRVEDTRSGVSFELAADRENALDVYYHPYAYATSQPVDYFVAA